MTISENNIDNQLLFVTFNQDCSSLVVGSRSGYSLYNLNSIDSLEHVHTYARASSFYIRGELEDVCIVQRLFSSSFIAMVSLLAPRKLKIFHYKKGTEICNYTYNNVILSVKLNRARLIVALEESLYIHNIKDMKVLHSIHNTPPNVTGLFALSTNVDNCFLAYPGSCDFGEIQIFDAVNICHTLPLQYPKIEKRAVTIIPAHENALAAMEFNCSGTKLATASQKGTVIRVFSSVDASKLFEFRRGVIRCVAISSLSFSSDSLYLAASSNTETMHVFKLETQEQASNKSTTQNSGTSSWLNFAYKAVVSTSSLLPAQVSDVLNQTRGFAYAHLPISSVYNKVAFCSINGMTYIMLASYNGYLYIYKFDASQSGELPLVNQLSFISQNAKTAHPDFNVFSTPDSAQICTPEVDDKTSNVVCNDSLQNENNTIVDGDDTKNEKDEENKVAEQEERRAVLCDPVLNDHKED